MKVKKIKETYIITDPPDSKVKLDINFKENDFDILRMHVETDSNIIEFAENLAAEQLGEVEFPKEDEE